MILTARFREGARSYDQMLFIGGLIVMGAYGCWRYIYLGYLLGWILFLYLGGIGEGILDSRLATYQS